MNAISLKLKSAMSYAGRGGVGPAQAFLKSSIVPIAQLDRFLPTAGEIWDLGCGEGILANLVATLRPSATILGVDRDSARLTIARAHAQPNARFEVADIHDWLARSKTLPSAIVFNDVIHHQDYPDHAPILGLALRRLAFQGVLVLKEVDQTDRIDRGMTTYFDRRLYSNDPLCFRSVAEWKALFRRLGVRDLEVSVYRHPWVASRTLMVIRKPRDTDAFAVAVARLVEPPPAAPSGVVDVLITGGTGFIGRHLVNRLLEHGLGGAPVRIHLLVRDPLPFIENKDPRLVPLLGDLADLPLHRDRLRSVRVAFHCAAEVKFTHGVDLERNNLDGTRSILTALRGIPISRFVHLSTIGAVDRTPQDPCTLPLTEDAPPNPLSQYGRTKLAAEALVRESGLPYTIVRVPWCYGSYMTPDTHVRALFEAVVRRKLYTWFNFPGRVSTITVSDLVDSLQLLASRPEALGETYFVADPEPVALGTLFRTMADLAGTRAGVIAIPSILVRLLRHVRARLPLTVQNLTNDVLCCSPAKVIGLGFRPLVLRREGLYRLAVDLGIRRLPDERRPVSLVTGAARGIGRAIAQELAVRMHRLLLVDRDPQELEQTAKTLGARSLVLDLADPAATELLAGFLSAEKLQLDWVVNNAGIGAAGDTATLPQTRLAETLGVNCAALTYLSRLALDHFRDGAGGTLVNIASSAAFQPLPRMAVYAASKAYVWSFSHALGEEVAQSKLGRVTTIAPSGTSTNFQLTAGVRTPDGERLMSPTEVARRIVIGAEEGKRTLILGRSAQAMFLLARLLPIRAQTFLWRRLMTALR